jgi:hypothetical protein
MPAIHAGVLVFLAGMPSVSFLVTLSLSNAAIAINSSGMKLAAWEQGSRIFESMRVVGRCIHRGPKSTFNTDQTYD